MSDSEYNNELEEKIKILETRLKHLTNDLVLTRSEYEVSMQKYFDIYSNMEQKVQERTEKLKELQDILKLKNLQLEIMVDASPGMIFYKDAQEHYMRVNKKFAETFGLSFVNIVGKSHREIFPDDPDNLLGNDLEVLQKKEAVLNQTAFVKTTRGEKRLLMNKVPYKDINGNVIGIIGFALDTTDMYRAEMETNDLKEKLARAEKMEAIGLLAGGVAHDLNNILTGIVSYPDLLLLELSEDSSLRRPIITIQESGLKAAAIVQDMLTLARRGVVRSEVANLNNVISEFLRSMEYEKFRMYHSGIKVFTNLEENLLNIKCSPSHIFKVMMNLVNNAVGSMPDGGSVTITTRNSNIEQSFKGYEDVHEGDYVLLQIQDMGVGMPENDLNRIFEPFYTKKVLGRSGTGLEMAVVWGIVKDHHGFIDIESREGEGTTIRLYFPVTREPGRQQKTGLTIEDLSGNGEQILVVDDIPEQRELASQMLIKLNYKVAAVPSGEKAIEYIKTNKVDLIVLDMIMDPGIDGLDTFKEIIKIVPGQKTIITSGYSETVRVREAQELGVGAYLKKPYLFDSFGRVIKEELNKK